MLPTEVHCPEESGTQGLGEGRGAGTPEGLPTQRTPTGVHRPPCGLSS